MNATTPGRTARPDSRTDLQTDLHGDIDRRGDIVDELTIRLGTPEMRAMARERRLAAAICADDPETARLQLARIIGALERCPA